MDSGGNHRRDIGKAGEELACGVLRDMGHIILERNWRSSHQEIDIISADADGIHFVEVKARQRNIQAPPQMSVDHAKQRNIVKAARQFLRTTKGLPYSSLECHFDIVAITFSGGEPAIEWFPQAYIPIYL
ncbi:MAG: YraN family protein [Bacteroidales bacterium]|nr:YraN family protein [Bacteroidales bacterium]